MLRMLFTKQVKLIESSCCSLETIFRLSCHRMASMGGEDGRGLRTGNLHSCSVLCIHTYFYPLPSAPYASVSVVQ